MNMIENKYFYNKFNEIEKKNKNKIEIFDSFVGIFGLFSFISLITTGVNIIINNYLYIIISSVIFLIFFGLTINFGNKWFNLAMLIKKHKIKIIENSLSNKMSIFKDYFKEEELYDFLLLWEQRDEKEDDICSILIEKEEEFYSNREQDKKIKQKQENIEKIKEKYQLFDNNPIVKEKEMTIKYNL